MAIIAAAILIIFFLSETSYGWGLATHMELAESLLSNAAILAGAAGTIILKHKKDFILGNLLADVMIGKKMSRRRKATHHWIGGLRLLENAEHNRTRAFAYGFLTHLAADTVAHNQFVPKQILRANSTILLGHLYWEVMADQLTDPAKRKKLRKLLENYSPVHDQQLEEYLYPAMKWFAFNKSVFRKVSRLVNDKKFVSAVGFCSDFSPNPLLATDLTKYKHQAMDRMVDILKNGVKSTVLSEDPNGCQALSDIRKRRWNSIVLPG
jgi:hypothetical protein